MYIAIILYILNCQLLVIIFQRFLTLSGQCHHSLSIFDFTVTMTAVCLFNKHQLKNPTQPILIIRFVYDMSSF